MIVLHTISIGQPRDIHDEQGEWRSSIYRTPVNGAIRLLENGLEGDQVTNTAVHGSRDQAVCCHALEHYAFWNAEYGLSEPENQLGPGSVGENWTLAGGLEAEVCIGDIFKVGEARVQVSGPRAPCAKQPRKLGLPDFMERTLETLRTGFYLKVLAPGWIESGQELILEARPCPDLGLLAVNACFHHHLDISLARRLVETPELSQKWRDRFQAKLRRSIAE